MKAEYLYSKIDEKTEIKTYFFLVYGQPREVSYGKGFYPSCIRSAGFDVLRSYEIERTLSLGKETL